MDTPIERRDGLSRKLLTVVGLVLAAIAVVGFVYAQSGRGRLRVDASRITTDIVTEGIFREYYPFDGTVEPAISVYLDIEEGGRVEKIFAEGGAR